MQEPRVLGIGEILWDVFPEGRQLGGAPGNFAYHVHQHGIPAAPVSAVGHDEPGEDILTELEKRGVDTRFIARVEHPTGSVQVELDEKGKPEYDIKENVAWDHLPVTDRLLELARSARALCFGSLAQRMPPSRKTIEALLAAAGDEALKVFDVNLRAPFYSADVVRSGLEACNVFKLSDDEVKEVAEMLGLPSKEATFADAVIDEFDLRMLVVTRGDSGSLVQTPDERDEHPGVKANVVSTVGAGDSFNATIVAGVLSGLSVAELHDRAAHVAAFVCEQSGAMPELPGRLRINGREE